MDPPQVKPKTRILKPVHIFISCFFIGLVTWNILTTNYHQFRTVRPVALQKAEKEGGRVVTKVAKKEGGPVLTEVANKEVEEELLEEGKIPGENCESNGLTASKVFIGEYENIKSESQHNLERYIKKCHLIPPSKLPYNLAYPIGDPSFEQGVRLYVQDKLLGGMKNGKFVDAGANNGEYISNTLVLERDYGWTGLLIEADPEVAQELLSKHRKSWVANVCAGIHPYPYKTTMYQDLNDNNKAVARLDSSHRFQAGPNWSSYEVKCLPLYLMMKTLNLTRIDYLSMDIEGVELEVLTTLPFDNIFVKVFSIETQPDSWTPVREFMKSKGYYFIHRIHQKWVEDDIFLHESLLKNIGKHA